MRIFGAWFLDCGDAVAVSACFVLNFRVLQHPNQLAALSSRNGNFPNTVSVGMYRSDWPAFVRAGWKGAVMTYVWSAVCICAHTKIKHLSVSMDAM